MALLRWCGSDVFPAKNIWRHVRVSILNLQEVFKIVREQICRICDVEFFVGCFQYFPVLKRTYKNKSNLIKWKSGSKETYELVKHPVKFNIISIFF